MSPPIYLDYNATTPVDPEVVAAMLPYLQDRFGNASSAHAYGYEAGTAIMAARTSVARLIGARPDEVVFTGGGSETDNLAIKGAVFHRIRQNPHVVSLVTEHPAVLATLQYLQARFDVEVTLVRVDQTGMVDPADVAEAIRPNTVLVTVMHANNEVGTIQPLEHISAVTRSRGVLFHVDAAQSAGKVPIDVESLGIDMLTLAGHKLYAPKGIGALYLRRGVKIDPLVHGSAQEHGLRAGTENVASIVGMGRATELAACEVDREASHLAPLRDRLHSELLEWFPGLQLNGHAVHRLPNTLNVSVCGTTGAALLGCAPDVAASTGSACHSGSGDPSPVLLAMGLSRERAQGAVRLSLGRWSSPDEVDRTVAALVAAYEMATGTAPTRVSLA